MRLNCDLGEGFDITDQKVMPWLHMANVACGAHAGDLPTMRRTVQLALTNDVEIVAHPGYPDRENFGRKSISMNFSGFKESLTSQIESLINVCSEFGGNVEYVKPHGALYNDMMKDNAVFEKILRILQGIFPQPRLVIQAVDQRDAYLGIANKFGVELLFEAFADRAYSDDCRLVPRSDAGSVLQDADSILLQTKTLCETGVITSKNGRKLVLKADLLCIHGDNEASVACVSEIKNLLDRNG